MTDQDQVTLMLAIFCAAGWGFGLYFAGKERAEYRRSHKGAGHREVMREIGHVLLDAEPATD
jgi:hypothetical protein